MSKISKQYDVLVCFRSTPKNRRYSHKTDSERVGKRVMRIVWASDDRKQTQAWLNRRIFRFRYIRLRICTRFGNINSSAFVSVLSLHFTNRLFLPHIILLVAAAIISVSLVLISCECSSVSDLSVSIFIGCGPSCLCLYAEIAWQSINVPGPIQKQSTPQINAKSNFFWQTQVARNVKLSD